MNDLISRADVEQTVEDNILCYTHSDRPIDQDPDTECHKAIRMALRMLRKDLRKLPSAQPELPPYVVEIEAEYQKAVKTPYIRKPLAKALHAVWKKHDREDVDRNECGAKMEEE